MNKSGPLIILVVLLVVLLAAKNFMYKSGMSTKEAEQALAQETQKLDTEQEARLGDVKAAAGANQLPEEISYNVATRNEHLITIGWYFDVKNQANQLALIDIIEAAKRVADKTNGAVGVEAVNLDVPANELSATAASVTGLGVALDGECITDATGVEYSDNPGEGNEFAFQKIEDALMLRLHIPKEGEGKIFGSDIQPQSKQ